MHSESATILNPDTRIEDIRSQFPILHTTVYGLPLVYFDNGATTQKPLAVLNAMDEYYREYNSNVHRGVHHLSQRATDVFEETRRKVTAYINAKHDYEVLYTKGTTESINLVAQCFGKAFVKPGNSVIISTMEHHSNIVPWQMMCEERGATLKVIPINEKGEILLEEFDKLLDDSVSIVSVNYISNSLGTVNPVREIIARAHAKGVPVLLDAAQAIQHVPIDVQELDVDFLAFSSHKMYGPTGIGILYGKEKWLNAMPPYQGGGEMIKTVAFEKTIYNELPFKFEAGTPAIAEVVGLGAAVDFINEIGLDYIQAREAHLMEYALNALSKIEGLRFVGQAKERSGVISFLVGNSHPFDVGELLDKQGIAVRTGHHCCQPLMDRFEIPGTVRVSLTFYNTEEEIDKLVAGLQKAVKILG